MSVENLKLTIGTLASDEMGGRLSGTPEGRKAAQYGAETVDFFHTDIFTNTATLYTDGNHPNTAGYEKITQIWFAALQPYLK